MISIVVNLNTMTFEAYTQKLIVLQEYIVKHWANTPPPII